MRVWKTVSRVRAIVLLMLALSAMTLPSIGLCDGPIALPVKYKDAPSEWNTPQNVWADAPSGTKDLNYASLWTYNSSYFGPQDFMSASFVSGGAISKGTTCQSIIADPIIASTGAKIESVTDFAVPVEMGLQYTRYYHSEKSGPEDVPGWTDSLSSYIDLTCNGSQTHCGSLTLYRANGTSATFLYGPNVSGVHPQSGNGLATLTKNADGTYTLHDEDATVQTYVPDAYGQSANLQSVKDTAGVGWTITRYPYNSQTQTVTTVVTHTNGSSFTVVLKNNSSPTGAFLGSNETVTDPAGNVYTYAMDPSGNYTQVNLPGSPGTAIQYKYDPTTSLFTEVDYNGVPYSYTTYDSAGRANGTHMADGSQATSIVYGLNTTGTTATITNPLGHTSVQQFGSSQALLSVSHDAVADCGSTVNSRVYDTHGNLQQTTDNNGNITRYTYAANGQLQTMTEAYGTSLARTTDEVWDSNASLNRLLSVTVEGWSKTTYTYNAQNRLASVSVTNLSGTGTSNQTLTTQYNYVLYGNGMVQTKSVVHPSPNNSDTDVYSYDAMGNLVSVVNALGQTTTYSSYSGLGEPGRVTGSNGDIIDTTYDGRGRVVTKTTYPAGVAATWSYAYDGFGLLANLTAPGNDVTTWSRNPYMQVTSITHNDKDGASTESFTYDAMGNITSDVIARGSDIGKAQTVVYDALGRPYQRKGANGQVETYAYDGNGNVLSATDALGNKTSYQYDALDRLTRTVDAYGGVTQLVYDAGDHPVSVTDPRGLVTSYAYDGLGQLWRQVSPDTGTSQFTYDGYGRRSSMTRADGTQTLYSYDVMNRVTSISAGGQTQSFSYDACTNGKGRLCSEGDATGTTSYSYTPEGWIAGRGFSISGTTYALGYGFDAVGHVTSVNYPDGNQATYTYTNGVVSGVSLNVGGSAVNGATAITYRPMDLAMASWTSSNGLSNTLGYDADARLTAINVPGVQSLGFTYDTANRITRIANGIDGSMTQSLGYDTLSRLTSVSSGADNESFQYDADGNRTTGTVNGVAQTYAYGSSGNQLTSFSSSPSAQYGYDAQGNTTLVNGTASYQYNPFNRLASAGGATNYIAPDGQRLRKAGGSTGTTYFAPDRGGALMAENDNGIWVDYVRLNGRLIGRISGGQVDAIHDDQVGRPEEMTNASQGVVWRAQNFPFTQKVTVANVTLNLGFPGQYYDAETQTWNNGYRDYNSALGRYLESDPLGLVGGMNTYAYVRNNPLSGTDPYGLWDWPSLPQGFVDAVTGFGDGVYSGITFGLGNLQDVRDLAGIDGGVNSCSKTYKAAHLAGALEGGAALGGATGVELGQIAGTKTAIQTAVLSANLLTGTVDVGTYLTQGASYTEQYASYAELVQEQVIESGISPIR